MSYSFGVFRFLWFLWFNGFFGVILGELEFSPTGMAEFLWIIVILVAYGFTIRFSGLWLMWLQLMWFWLMWLWFVRFWFMWLWFFLTRFAVFVMSFAVLIKFSVEFFFPLQEFTVPLIWFRFIVIVVLSEFVEFSFSKFSKMMFIWLTVLFFWIWILIWMFWLRLFIVFVMPSSSSMTLFMIIFVIIFTTFIVVSVSNDVFAALSFLV